MFQGDIGTKATDCVELVPLQVAPGATVTVTNIGPNTITYINSLESVSDGTIASTASQSFTQPAWIYAGTAQSGSRSSVQITGGNY